MASFVIMFFFISGTSTFSSFTHINSFPKRILQRFHENFSNLSVYYMDDKEIKDIINEEMAAFYVGDKSIDDVIRFINDRVDKYISEAK